MTQMTFEHVCILITLIIKTRIMIIVLIIISHAIFVGKSVKVCSKELGHQYLIQSSAFMLSRIRKMIVIIIDSTSDGSDAQHNSREGWRGLFCSGKPSFTLSTSSPSSLTLSSSSSLTLSMPWSSSLRPYPLSSTVSASASSLQSSSSFNCNHHLIVMIIPREVQM